MGIRRGGGRKCRTSLDHSSWDSPLYGKIFPRMFQDESVLNPKTAFGRFPLQIGFVATSSIKKQNNEFSITLFLNKKTTCMHGWVCMLLPPHWIYDFFSLSLYLPLFCYVSFFSARLSTIAYCHTTTVKSTGGLNLKKKEQ